MAENRNKDNVRKLKKRPSDWGHPGESHSDRDPHTRRRRRDFYQNPGPHVAQILKRMLKNWGESWTQR